MTAYADSLAKATEALGADHQTTLQFTNNLASGYLGIDRPEQALPLFTQLEIQYRTKLPWWLVLVHVTLAASVWAAAVVFTAGFWRRAASRMG